MLSEFRPRSLTLTTPRRSHLYSHGLVTNVLRLLWVVLVIWGDLGTFYWSLSGCSWPEVDIGHKSRQKPKTTHVLLVADTQVHHTLLLAPGSWWANPIRRAMFELNLHKNWHVTTRLRPHIVIFLGDMLANGKAAQNLEEYREAVRYFKSIFLTDPRTAVYYVPGNNDVGLGSIPAVASNLRSYYTDSFGPLNRNLIISNHTFIALDAPALVDEDYQRHAKSTPFSDWKPIEGGPVEYVKEMGEYGPGNVVLLTHIPLARPETADCGPLREKGRIRRAAGPGYQSMLGKQTTSFLLKNLDPLVVFSADNRDYCDYTHVMPGTRIGRHNPANAVREVTVKSFSMSVHIKRPGFQLLSLVDPAMMHNPEFSSFADAPCILADQHWIYKSFYLPCIFFTLLGLFVLNFYKGRSKAIRKPELSITPSPRSSGRSTPNPAFCQDPSQFSATWSPFSPPIPVSPRATLPAYLRTPRSQSGPITHLVASLPGTPGPSSPSSLSMPIPLSEIGDEDEDDMMYPAQYATRREGHLLRQRDEDEWSQIGHNDGREEQDFELVHHQEPGAQNPASPKMQSQFISAPDHGRYSNPKSYRSSWSYTFTFGGRRRRIALGVPSLNSLYNLLDLFGFNDSPVQGVRKRRSKLMAFIIDTLSVFWPAAVMWLIINWTIL